MLASQRGLCGEAWSSGGRGTLTGSSLMTGDRLQPKDEKDLTLGAREDSKSKTPRKARRFQGSRCDWDGVTNRYWGLVRESSGLALTQQARERSQFTRPQEITFEGAKRKVGGLSSPLGVTALRLLVPLPLG